MAIPQHTIDQILDRTDIVDLIGQRVKLKSQVAPIQAVVRSIKKNHHLFTCIVTNSISTVLVVRPMVMPFVF